ncbi:MAG: hypothetical protein QM715_17885 [Nibricoccus sp.]
MKLAESIVKRQSSDNASKAVGVEIDMVAFAEKAKSVKTWQTDIEQLSRRLEELTGQRNQLLGISEGQNLQTKGTLLFEIMRIRDLLLGASRGNEKALEPWGFDVTVGEAKAPTRKAKAVAV